MMNPTVHTSRTGLGGSIITALLFGCATAALLVMALYAGFCA